MPQSRSSQGRARAAETNMDEILASIQRIIDEEPIGPRHRYDTTRERGRRSVLDGFRPHEMSRPLGASGRPLAGSVVSGSRAVREDEVLAELLEPEATPAVARGDVAAARGRPEPAEPVQAVATVAAASDGAAPLPESTSSEDAAVEPVSPNEPRSEAFAVHSVSAKPAAVPLHRGADLPSTDDVLADLAAGLNSLSALMAQPAAALVVGIAPPPQGLACAASDVRAEFPLRSAPGGPLGFAPCAPSPAEAAAAAVAAVAAVNAAALQTGGRAASAAAPDDAVNGPLSAVAAAVEPPEENDAPVTPPVAVAFQADTNGSVHLGPPVPHTEAEKFRPAPSPDAEPATAPLVVAPSALEPQPAASFEDAISAMLRPLLREWLDANLPRMVEKALKDELAGVPARAILAAT